MASFVNAADAVAAAVEIETRGHAFYLAVADKAVDAADKEFFTFMAEEEKRHKATFASMLGRLGGVPMPAGSTDEEYLMYVQDLLDSHSLFMKEQQQSILADPYVEAIRFEKDTLLFFDALEPMVPAAEAKYIRACADEERKHLRMLAKRMVERKKLGHH